jgi:hypothetical protein
MQRKFSLSNLYVKLSLTIRKICTNFPIVKKFSPLIWNKFFDVLIQYENVQERKSVDSNIE